MDLSIFERVFALRDEARKAQVGADAPDLSSLSHGADGRQVVRPPELPHEKLAAELMARALALHEEANKSRGKKDRASRAPIVELIHAASARLPAFEESDLAAELTAPTDKPEGSALTSELETRDEEPSPAPAKRAAPRRKKGDDGTTKRK